MQDGYVERFDQKISHRPWFSLRVRDRSGSETKEGYNNFPLAKEE